MKEELKKVAVTVTTLALITVGYFQFTTTDEEIRVYIEEALVRGCRPVIDVCSGDCKAIDLTQYGVAPECVPENILRVSPKRAQDQYFFLAKEYGIGTDIPIQNMADLPYAIREQLKEKYRLELPKEELSIKIENVVVEESK